MDDKKLLIKKNKNLIEILAYLVKSQKIFTKVFDDISDYSDDSRISKSTYVGVKELNKNMKIISKHILELQAILKAEESNLEK